MPRIKIVVGLGITGKPAWPLPLWLSRRCLDIPRHKAEQPILLLVTLLGTTLEAVDLVAAIAIPRVIQKFLVRTKFHRRFVQNSLDTKSQQKRSVKLSKPNQPRQD